MRGMQHNATNKKRPRRMKTEVMTNWASLVAEELVEDLVLVADEAAVECVTEAEMAAGAIS
jgi:hypothetical protein